MINAAQFDFGGGPDMKGSWKNYKTGEVINIRDTVIENNQIIGITTNGQQVPFSKLQSFVKLEKPEATSGPTKQRQDSPRQTIKLGNLNKKPIPVEIDDSLDEMDGYGILPEDQELLNMSSSQKAKPNMISKTDPAITKVLDGLSEKESPKIAVDIKWNTIPEGVVFLKKYLNISEDDLTIAIINKYINIDDVMESLKDKLTDIIQKGLEDQPKEKKTKKSES